MARGCGSLDYITVPLLIKFLRQLVGLSPMSITARHIIWVWKMASGSNTRNIVRRLLLYCQEASLSRTPRLRGTLLILLWWDILAITDLQKSTPYGATSLFSCFPQAQSTGGWRQFVVQPLSDTPGYSFLCTNFNREKNWRCNCGVALNCFAWFNNQKRVHSLSYSSDLKCPNFTFFPGLELLVCMNVRASGDRARRALSNCICNAIYDWSVTQPRPLKVSPYYKHNADKRSWWLFR